MGQHLSEPVTTKETSGSANSQYRCASSSMQGWRISILSLFTLYTITIYNLFFIFITFIIFCYYYIKYFFYTLFFSLTECPSDMEDAHTQLLSMKEDKDAAFFAVFDGHGGKCNNHFSSLLTCQLNILYLCS